MSSALGKYGIQLPQKPLSDFERADIEKIITFHIGKIVPRVLKEFDQFIDKKKEFTARQTSLLINGKNDKREAYKMKTYVDDYIAFYKDIEFSIISATEDILEEIITDMNQYTKNSSRKTKFINTLDSLNGQMIMFTLAVMSIGESLIKRHRTIENGRYLEHVLKAKRELTDDIKTIYKAFHRGELTLEEVNYTFRELIDKKVQDAIKFDSEIYNAIKFEEDLYSICDQDTILEFVYSVIENARVKVTSKNRLISLLEF